VTTPSAGERFLLDFHARDPGATSRALTGARDALGRDSYDWLAALADPGDTVCDLACGDGPLIERLIARGVAPGRIIGVDASAAELRRARRRPALRGVDLRRERAQALSLPDGSVDLVLCHLALMIFDDVEGVLAEVARVLRPGGTLSAVVDGDEATRGAEAVFVEQFRAVAEAERLPAPPFCDERLRTESGARAMLASVPALAASIEVRPRELVLDDTAEALWRFFAASYAMPLLTPAGRAHLERAFCRALRPLTGPDGRAPCRVLLWHLTCRRV
jgi:SAM-dependent methyltransferase